MNEYFIELEDIKKSFYQDLTYLESNFEGELFSKLKKTLLNHYQDIYYQKIKIINKYTNFDMRILGPILASIVSVFEGHLFVYQDLMIQAKPNEKNYVNYLAIVDEKYVGGDLQDLISNNLAYPIYKNYMLLLRGTPTKSVCDYEINFYSIRNDNIQGEENISYILNTEQIPYLKEFIDYVIDYRFKNNILNIKEEDLLNLRKEFINFNKKDIMTRAKNYYKIREQEVAEEIVKLNKSLEEEKNNHELLLTKVLNYEK